MSFLKRLSYYLGGFSVGIVLLVFFLGGKNTRCTYTPDARVINDFSKNLPRCDLDDLRVVREQARAL